MDPHLSLAPALRIALAWQPRSTRSALAALFALDRRLGTMVSQAREPMLAQIRLAWWRDQLGQGSTASEPLLGEIARQWNELAPRLVSLVDGWENLLGDPPPSAEAAEAFAAGRGQALGAFADLVGEGTESARAVAAGRNWALADIASRGFPSHERDETSKTPRARALRGVAVLGGLASRALERGEPLLHDRRAALAAIRLGMFGR